jgi:hypothetical protein
LNPTLYPSGWRLGVESGLDVVDQGYHVVALGFGGLPPGGNAPFGDDQGVAGAGGKGVPDGEGGVVASDPAIGRNLLEGRQFGHQPASIEAAS